MLLPEQIKPFLIHDDVDVRRKAASYFTDSWSDDPEILPLLLEACERHGTIDDRRNLYHADKLRITAESLDRVLEFLGATRDKRAAEYLNKIIARAPIEVLSSRLEAIEGHPKVSQDARSRIDRRRELREWTDDRLWEELRALARRADDEYAEVSSEAEEEALIDALIHRESPDSETICRLLKELEAEESWLEIFLVTITGGRQLREAVPILVEKFRIDADLLLEATSDALARIGDPTTVDLIRRAYPGADWSARLSHAVLLGKLKSPESESAILEIIEAEPDALLRMWLCQSLCDLVSDRSVEFACRLMTDRNSETFRELAGSALAMVAMLGIEPPREAASWDRERNRQHNTLRRFERLYDNDGIDPEEGPARGFLEPEPVREVVAQDVTMPIRNEGARVGRNDPCPCGSGKKYKKCCGRAGG